MNGSASSMCARRVCGTASCDVQSTPSTNRIDPHPREPGRTDMPRSGRDVIPDGMAVAGQESDATRPVNVGAVLDRHDRDRAEVVVNAVDHPVVAAAGAMQSGKAELERLADPPRGLGQ